MSRSNPRGGDNDMFEVGDTVRVLPKEKYWGCAKGCENFSITSETVCKITGIRDGSETADIYIDLNGLSWMAGRFELIKKVEEEEKMSETSKVPDRYIVLSPCDLKNYTIFLNREEAEQSAMAYDRTRNSLYFVLQIISETEISLKRLIK
jgi:hypothetical protein